MTTSESLLSSMNPELHVFEQSDGWHWGITIPRSKGTGFKLIAFSDRPFAIQNAAHEDGRKALAELDDNAVLV